MGMLHDELRDALSRRVGAELAERVCVYTENCDAERFSQSGQADASGLLDEAMTLVSDLAQASGGKGDDETDEEAAS